MAEGGELHYLANTIDSAHLYSTRDMVTPYSMNMSGIILDVALRVMKVEELRRQRLNPKVIFDASSGDDYIAEHKAGIVFPRCKKEYLEYGSSTCS